MCFRSAFLDRTFLILFWLCWKRGHCGDRRWFHFRSLLALFSIFFSRSICWWKFDCTCFDFDQNYASNLRKEMSLFLHLFVKCAPENVYKTHPRRNHDFSYIFYMFWKSLWWFIMFGAPILLSLGRQRRRFLPGSPSLKQPVSKGGAAVTLCVYNAMWNSIFHQCSWPPKPFKLPQICENLCFTFFYIPAHLLWASKINKQIMCFRTAFLDRTFLILFWLCWKRGHFGDRLWFHFRSLLALFSMFCARSICWWKFACAFFDFDQIYAQNLRKVMSLFLHLFVKCAPENTYKTHPRDATTIFHIFFICFESHSDD